jgi:AcrR family transcriptional regulator
VTRRRRLFYERGVHAVGVDLIATEAGVTRKTLYDRFGSKEQIVVEYLADRDERRPAFLAQCLDTAQLTSAARVLAVFDASRAWSAKNSSKGCGMVNAHAEISDPSHPAYQIITGQKQWSARPVRPGTCGAPVELEGMTTGEGAQEGTQGGGARTPPNTAGIAP